MDRNWSEERFYSIIVLVLSDTLDNLNIKVCLLIVKISCGLVLSGMKKIEGNIMELSMAINTFHAPKIKDP